MRIYLSSSFGNGKTTLKKRIAKIYKLRAIPEIARTVLAEREITDLSLLRSNTELLYDVQKEILDRQYKEEQLAKDDFVCCRGLDTVSFLVNFAEDEDVEEFMQSDLYKNYVNWLKQENVYTFLVKPDKSILRGDGIRDTDWDLSSQLFGSTKTLLRINGIKYSLIGDTNMSDRVGNIRRVINGT